jgi:hypothetical protein
MSDRSRCGRRLACLLPATAAATLAMVGTANAAMPKAGPLVSHTLGMVIAIDPRTDQVRGAALPGETVVRDRDGKQLFRAATKTDVSGAAAAFNGQDPVWQTDPGPVAAAPGSDAATVRAVRPGGGYACVSNRAEDPQFRIYRPTYASYLNRAEYVQFTYHLYKRSVARTVGGETRKQFEMCTVGGAHSRGGWRLTRVVSSFAAVTPVPTIVGSTGGNQVDDSGVVQASLDFKVDKGPITISASLTPHRQNTFAWSQGPDKDLDLGRHNRLAFNQVNTYWESPDTFIFDGSTEFQGNVGQGLYELRQTARDPIFIGKATNSLICGKAGSKVGLARCAKR